MGVAMEEYSFTMPNVCTFFRYTEMSSSATVRDLIISTLNICARVYRRDGEEGGLLDEGGGWEWG